MKDPVLLKGNAFGLTIVLDDQMSFSQLLQCIGDKFQQAKDFFNNQKQIAARIEGRQLSYEELDQVVQQIYNACSLRIVYVMEHDIVEETRFKETIKASIKEHIKEASKSDQRVNGQFYQGDLQAGYCLEADGSVIILGDVKQGAKVSASGNIVVLGAVRGTVYAGTNDNNHAFVVALDLNPTKLRIGRYLGQDFSKKRRWSRQKKKVELSEAKIAFVEEGYIYMEPVSKSLIRSMNL